MPPAVVTPAPRAAWLWVHEAAPPDAAAVAAFLAGQRVHEAFVSVPGAGPSEHTRACVSALRDRGIRVSALGGDPSWVEGRGALRWMERATGGLVFDGVHLDIEPWSTPDWAGNEDRRLAGLERAVRDVAAHTGLPVEVDLAPWLATTHPPAFTRIASAADALTLLAYRDRADAILAISAAARGLLRRARVPYRIGVETRPVRHPAPTAGETFADEGRAAMEAALVGVATRIDPRDRFAGLAVHDVAGWVSLGA
ncbi:hypothetical protein [Agrococcus sp. ProA11]|uniref:hypothetical protein n=1 Tax=Agrococcus chionoecetis TaxID=3153752 RepID=UPI003260DFB7